MELFSIDVEAHLQKLAENSYRSPAHFPVELVRSALRRKANRVEITIGRDAVTIMDDGCGIDPESWRRLLIIFDDQRPAPEREAAIVAFQDPQGIGLLSMFSRRPERVLVRNVHKGENRGLVFEHGRAKEMSSSLLEQGTLLTVFRRGDQQAEECRTLREYCRWADREIILNGQGVPKLIAIPGALVCQRVNLPLSGTPSGANAMVAIPRLGELSRIWLLEQGIPWQQRALPPVKGLVLMAAVESAGGCDAAMLAGLASCAEELYRWLARRYREYPADVRDRVEELLFGHHRLTGDDRLLEHFAPFLPVGSQVGLTAAEIRQMTVNETVWAIRRQDESSLRRPPSRTVLALSRRQADFLLNRLELPIRFLSRSAAPVAAKSLAGLRQGMINQWRRLVGRRLANSRRIIDNDQLDPEEKELWQLLLEHLRSQVAWQPQWLTGKNIGCRMVESPWWIGAAAVEGLENSLQIVLNRRHRLIRQAVTAVAQDRSNIELLAALLPLPA